MSKTSFSFAPDRNENALLSLLFNIALPVLLLNKLTDPLKDRFGEHGPAIALIVALAFPTIYGLADYIKKKKKNAISILGFLNILMTGGLALMQLEGIWFAVKEAAFPLLIGLFVFSSIYGSKPFMQLFIYNENFLNISLLEEKLKENGQDSQLNSHFKKSTVFMSGSFLLSAILNFILAIMIFKPISAEVGKTEHAAILNQQIADMTWLSWFVIMIPSMICLFVILWHFFSGLQKMTGLKLNDIVRTR